MTTYHTIGCACNRGTLGRDVDGDLIFCHCLAGQEERMSHYLSLLDSYAEQLNRYDLGVRLSWHVMPFDEATRAAIQIAYDIARDEHDRSERRWYKLQGKALPVGLVA